MNRIDRRALFTSGAAATLLAAAGVSAHASPRSGGVLRLAVPRDDSLEQVARGAVFDTLTEIGPDGTLRGELVTGWTCDAEARNWMFTLRSEARFHDGSRLRAEDVIAVLEQVGRTDIIAPGEVRVELADGNPGLPFLLSDSRFVVTPSGQGVVPLHKAVGTGCYRVERAQDGRHFLGRRVTGHYKDGQAGWADAIEIVVIPDAKVRAEALRDGFVDVAALPSPGGLRERTKYRFHPSEADMALAAAASVGMPAKIGTRSALDDGRIAERWWLI